MDDRISSAVYNPANPYDTSTAMGNQNLTESWGTPTTYGNFPSSLKVALLQLVIFSAIGLGFVFLS